MQEHNLYEYAIVRVMPRVEREEFINIGVVLYCSANKSLTCRIVLDENRLKMLDPQVDIEELKLYIKSFEMICKGGKDAGPIGQLSPAERFRWLTATRSTILQTSKVHPGFCKDAQHTLDRLFEGLVKIEKA